MFEPMRGSPIFLKAFQQGHRPVAAGSAWYGQGIDRGIVNNHPVLGKSLMSAIFENDMRIFIIFLIRPLPLCSEVVLLLLANSKL